MGTFNFPDIPAWVYVVIAVAALVIMLYRAHVDNKIHTTPAAAPQIPLEPVAANFHVSTADVLPNTGLGQSEPKLLADHYFDRDNLVVAAYTIKPDQAVFLDNKIVRDGMNPPINYTSSLAGVSLVKPVEITKATDPQAVVEKALDGIAQVVQAAKDSLKPQS